MSYMTPIDREILNNLFSDVPYFKSIDNREVMGFDIAQNHLKTIWGNRSDWKINLNNYFDKCRSKNTEHEDSLIIDADDIYKMISDEEEYNKNISLVKGIQNKQEQNDEDIIKASNILGIGPSPVNNSIYKYLVDRNGISYNEIKKFYDTENLYGLLKIIIMCLMKQYEEGMLVTVPPETSVMRQMPSKYYYRGENAVYDISGPSIYRKQREIKKYRRIPKNVEGVIEDLKMAELSYFLYLFDSVKNWKYSTINVYAIAQHYGINTMMLDLTSSIKTALFFMSCKWERDSWYPLTLDDVKKNPYGVLYRSLSELTIINRFLNPEEQYEVILPIGYQPFMRCSTQYGYFIASKNSQFNLKENKYFERFRIKQNPDFCEWIYSEMKAGDKIYPQEDIPDISEYIKIIDNTHHFSKDSFDMVLEQSELKSFEKIILRDLNKYGYNILNTASRYISKHRIDVINKRYTSERVKEYMKTDLKIQPRFLI